MVTSRAIIIDTSGVRIAGAAMLLAATAWPLLPDGAGIPCPLRSLTGIPCPLCGMTTSVVNTVHGDLISAVQANPFGPVLIVAVIALFARRRRNEERIAVALIIPLIAASWMFQLIRFGWL